MGSAMPGPKVPDRRGVEAVGGKRVSGEADRLIECEGECGLRFVTRLPLAAEPEVAPVEEMMDATGTLAPLAAEPDVVAPVEDATDGAADEEELVELVDPCVVCRSGREKLL